MRSFGAFALFALFITGCLSAQSERSRQRSGPIRSVPVAADIKRDVNFDCPEEFGYYPHPSDCTLYYVCVFGGALLESCTGGLMYSHELQTCDWPRNVGCDSTLSIVRDDDLERLNERAPPPPPPPPRRQPLPQPRSQPQPNPVITSRGQPKFNREEYEKQQQLYADVDDFAPVEEIESDRQQRVNREQPQTIGQVQKDRDGYGSQVVNSRTINSNIIPASIPQNSGKIGSFSIGTQVDDRKTATPQSPRAYSLEPTESLAPASFSPSPRPKMLYNGSQNYSPDQFDPFYAVYDEDGELYKDTDYVQQYNTASLRPAVQQTYRGTPPPARRPVESYTPRPLSSEDYDDALVQGQINNQNQYQVPIRQSTRGEGNELGYDHNPSSVKTTLYEAPSISTTPSTTSTSTTTTTTTQRPTTAPFTEAMTPSRYTQRSSTDESPKRNPVPNSQTSKNPSDGSTFKDSSSPSSINYLSSLAKPFEKTDNSHRLGETLTLTKKLENVKLTSDRTNTNFKTGEQQISLNKDHKKVVSLTTGFSIRRNVNNTNNPYTLTVLTRPYDEYNHSWKDKTTKSPESESNIGVEESVEASSEKDAYLNKETSESSMRRKDSESEIVDEDDVTIYKMPTSESRSRNKIRIKTTLAPTSSTKYYLKTVIKRPAPFSATNNINEDSTENIVNTNALIDTALNNVRTSDISDNTSDIPLQNSPALSQNSEDLNVSPYKTLSNLQNNPHDTDSSEKQNEREINVDDHTSSTANIRYVTATPERSLYQMIRNDKTSKPTYFSYKVVDEIVPDHTTEVFSGKIKNVIKAFFNNFGTTLQPIQVENYLSSTSSPTTKYEERTVNIGFHKKTPIYPIDRPTHKSRIVTIVTEPNLNKISTHNDNTFTIKTNDNIPTTTTVSTSTTNIPITYQNQEMTREVITESSYKTKFKFAVDTTESEEHENESLFKINGGGNVEPSRKFLKYATSEKPSYADEEINNFNVVDNDLTKQTQTNVGNIMTTENDSVGPTYKTLDDIASTTSTTKSTTTAKLGLNSTTKSISFPTRPSRVNPAIKLAATNFGGGRRSYQSSSNCSSDNSLQANPKCNEIKYQRPSSTRGRGSAHYSTATEAAPQPPPHRGTPPTRNRPTLKPSTAIVSKASEFVDIYTHPPSRPAPVYPQPTPDKTAAKCRKDVCLLPDCYCGGKDIPGDLPVESVPQIVLLTFDDSVNDLNKGLYADLFEKGRVNPNGCPITATFYVSHEWTDYSQVQNLYSAGHEMASHTISHSFGEQFSQKKWNREVAGQREILAAYGGVKVEDVRGMRAPFLSVGGNKMFKMLYDSNFTYDSSMPVYENRPPSWPYTLDYKIFHDCMIPPCPTKSYPGVWEVPMVMWQDLNGGRCSMGDACANPPEAENVYKMLLKNFDRHYTTNRAPFGLFYHAAWFTQPHHKAGFIMFLDFINQMQDVYIVTNWQALQWVRDPTPLNRLNNFQPFQCNYQDRPKKCNNPKVCNLWHKSGVRYMRTCQPCPEIYPWTGKSGIRSSRVDNDIDE